jgi:2'-5' RNA ligase
MVNYLKLLMEERTTSAPYGCLMAKIADSHAKKLIEFGNKIISEDILYNEGGEFGREKTPHVTIKYGFDPDLTELEIRKLIRGIKPFTVSVHRLSLFNNNPAYDVVKLDVDSPTLRQIRELCESYPNKDTYPEYHPHLTLAYVQKGTFTPDNKNITMSLPVNEIYYSPGVGEKSYFNL